MRRSQSLAVWTKLEKNLQKINNSASFFVAIPNWKTVTVTKSSLERIFYWVLFWNYLLHSCSLFSYLLRIFNATVGIAKKNSKSIFYPVVFLQCPEMLLPFAGLYIYLLVFIVYFHRAATSLSGERQQKSLNILFFKM